MEDMSEAHSEENRVPADKNIKRKLKTPAQVIALENFYNEHKYPTEEMKSKLAQHIGLTEKQISSWFCHRRLKDNKSLRDETHANGRLDRSSGIIQDRGSGLRQDSCGSTKQGDYRNIEAREAESERLYGHDISAADVTHDYTSRYRVSSGHMDDTSSESGSSLQDKIFPQNANHFDMEGLRYLTQNGAIMPLIPKGAASLGHKPSGYLKVKGEIENAAITAVKRQLGRNYREDGPPLGVEFQELPPDAFVLPSRDTVTGSFYVGDLARIHSPDVPGIRKHSSLTNYDARSSHMTSPDSYLEVPKCEPKHGSDSFERKSHKKQKKKSSSYNYSNFNPGGNSPMDCYDDVAGEMSAYGSKRKYSMISKHGIEGMKSDSVSNDHSPEGRRHEREQMEPWLHRYDAGSPKMGEHNDFVPKPSKLMLGSGKSSNIEWGAPYRRIAKENKLFREMKEIEEYGDPVRVNKRPENEKKVAKRSRVEIPPQEYASRASFPDIAPRKTPTKGPAIERPSSFSEDEAAEPSSSGD
ncbi:hypothetical protein K2173_016412 [Erythroxylum novogranatense]|uniref:Homeobox domain-containing protein n=1 Tax=Erythroxylum novogranatense TaxID=1862640 RepID=A0AAV8SGV1_9ROSI|nr:hypothetical protein K2173_016412 [Erythroxylum novogranatense]